jgi:glycosyltransferase involved in cell wall biosynthesis
MDLISIVIPCFNGELYLVRCIESLLAQSYPHIEIIVIDDDSEDRSLLLLNEYKDTRIRVLRNVQNLGAGLSRNKCIEACSGKYVFFCDIDDFVEPNYISELHQSIHGFDCSIGSYKVISAKNIEVVNVSAKVYSCEITKTLGIINGHVGFGLALWNKLFSLDVIQTNKIKFKDIRRCEDSVFALEYFSRVNNVNVVSTKHYYCHLKDNETSITNTINNSVVEGYLQVSDEFYRYKAFSPKHTNIVLYRQYISQKKSIMLSSCSSRDKQAFIKILKNNKKTKNISLFAFLYSLFFVRDFSLKRKVALLAFVTFNSKYDKLKKLFS